MAIETYDHKPLCANCQNSGTIVCTNCRLVTYCSGRCQTAHWTIHKLDCESPLRSESWLPRWAVEDRPPTWLARHGSSASNVQQASVKYLWGNMPALDVLNLRSNEGESFSEDIKLLFAASGDLRNVVKTFAALPKSYNGTLMVTINDHEPHVVVRNVIMCILAASINDVEQASECITHIWYSAFIRQTDLELLKAHVLPLVSAVCLKIKDEPLSGLQSETWQAGKCSLRVAMSKEAWQLLSSCLTVRPDLTLRQAQALHLAIVNDPARQDTYDRTTVKQSPAHRVSKQKFREDGIILPFEYSREAFVIPNPTSYQAGTWPLVYYQDPISGWNFAQVIRTPCGETTNDLTGKLYCHIRSHIQGFHKYLSERGASFEFLNVDAAELPNILPKSAFARIEVSNACDGAYLGPERTLTTLGPLLQRASVNPHATLLTLFMAAVDDAEFNLPASATEQEESHRFALERAFEYQSMLKLLETPAVFNSMLPTTLRLFRDHESLFGQYCVRFGFPRLKLENKLEIKAANTIVERWPLALTLSKGDVGFDEEFETLEASSSWGAETYVEWASVE